jgi:hypothetical protein
MLDGALGERSYANPGLPERRCKRLLARGGHDYFAAIPTKAGC